MKNILLGLTLIASLALLSGCHCGKKEEIKVPVEKGSLIPEKTTTVSVEKDNVK